MTKAICFAVAMGLTVLATPVRSLDRTGVDVCENDLYLQEQMLSRYISIQRDQYRSLPWRIFVVMREFQRNGFRINDQIRATICDGDRWLYGDSADDFTVPVEAPHLRQSAFDTVG